MGVILISHDLGVVAEAADRIAVMYRGWIIEEGPVDEIVNRPRHPYTRGLIGATPAIDSTPKAELPTLTGTVRELNRPPVACVSPNAARTRPICAGTPPQVAAGPGMVRRWMQTRSGMIMHDQPATNGPLLEVEEVRSTSRCRLVARRCGPSTG